MIWIINSTQILPLLDILRGFAVLGTLGTNIWIFAYLGDLSYITTDVYASWWSLNDFLRIKQVREIVSDMNFISLENELYHCKNLFQTANISFKLQNKCSNILLASVEETMLALCLREATTNLLKHSQARNCKVEIDCSDHMYCLKISDDGVGLENKGLGNGITSIKERMNALPYRTRTC